MSVNKNERRWALEGFLGRLDELKTVLGADVAPVLEKVKTEIAAGIAERERGDLPAATARIAHAMSALAALGDRVGEDEGMLMRAFTGQFTAELARGDKDAVERSVDRIQAKAGTPKTRN